MPSSIPLGYCQCGCGERTRLATHNYPALGLRTGDPMRFLFGHGRCKGVEYVVDSDTGCWNWNRYVGPTGYGMAGSRKAHRAMYEREVGPIPPGMDLDHLCRNKQCVNPAHLEPVTEAENVRRGRSAKLTHSDVAQIRARLASGIQQVQIAAEFGVSKSTISLIGKGVTWRA